MVTTNTNKKGTGLLLRKHLTPEQSCSNHSSTPKKPNCYRSCRAAAHMPTKPLYSPSNKKDHPPISGLTSVQADTCLLSTLKRTRNKLDMRYCAQAARAGTGSQHGHQQLMLIRQGDSGTARCGNLDKRNDKDTKASTKGTTHHDGHCHRNALEQEHTNAFPRNKPNKQHR